MHLNVHNKMAVFGLVSRMASDPREPPSFVVSALKMISAIAPSWRVVPASDMLDKVCKDPQFKKEVTKRLSLFEGQTKLRGFHNFCLKLCAGPFKSIHLHRKHHAADRS
jgi:hypothetical protein